MKEMRDQCIRRCREGHFFVTELCPFCELPALNFYSYQDGDCVACGCLCPDYAYGCNSYSPLTIAEFME